MAWVPHTIPKKLFKAYTPGSMRDDPESLKRQYKGRILRSEDPDWQDEHEDLKKEKQLKESNLNLIIDNYEYMVTLTREQNKVSLQEWEKEKASWESQLADYHKRKDSYDKKKMALEIAAARRAYGALGVSSDDSNSDDAEHETNESKLASLKEPEKVPEVFKPFVPQMMILDRLTNFERMVVIEELNDLVIPFEMAVETIPDDYYWERSALKKWPNICRDSNTSWRQTYLEHYINITLEDYHPWEGNLDELLELVKILSQEISAIRLNQLIPICYGIPAKPPEEPPQGADIDLGKGADQDFDDGIGEMALEMEALSKKMTVAELQKDYITKMREAKAIKIQIPMGDGEDEGDEQPEDTDNLVPPERYDSSHLDLGLIFPKIVTLVKVSLVYDMLEIGLDWEERLATFTDKDCLNLARALVDSPSIEIFELNKSHMTGEQCKTLVREGFIHMVHLKSLNLSYNKIGDVGARALARLITDKNSKVPHTLHTLKICRNEIRSKGAKALAYALSLNTYMTELDIRLNFIKNPGGQDFGHALATNRSLQRLLISANRLGPETCYVIGKMLVINDVLLELDLSSNNLESKGGEYLALGMRSNKKLLTLDVRLANIGSQFAYDIMVHLKKNRERVDYSIVDIEDYYPPENEEVIVEPEEEEYSSEEEEEEDEDTVTVIKPAKKEDGSSDSDNVM